MKFIEIEWCSPEYQASLELRHEVLRKPLKLRLTPEELDGEFEQLHFGLLDEEDESLIAIVVAKPLSPENVQLRQMAVATEYHRQGFGSDLLTHVESNLAERGYKQCELHARTTVLEFYDSRGYQHVGDPFEEVGIPHQKMVKPLNS